jgi:threonine/homoserine/homoserine lactone efflux protein
MDLLFLLKGIITGFGMAVPIGPIGIICIRKTLYYGKSQGHIVGLGAAIADLFYGCIAAFGISFISNFIAHERVWIRVVGGILLFIIGVKTYFAKPKVRDDKITETKGITSFISVLFLTLSNPLTFFAFIAIFSALGIEKEFEFFSAISLVIGVFIGSFGWFFLLSSFVNRYKNKVSAKGWFWLNKVAGIIIIVSGGIAIGGLFLR